MDLFKGINRYCKLPFEKSFNGKCTRSVMVDSKITGCRTNDKENVFKVEKKLIDTAFVMYVVAAIGFKI